MADTKPPDNRGDVDPRLYGAESRGNTAKAEDAREGVSHFVMITCRPHSYRGSTNTLYGSGDHGKEEQNTEGMQHRSSL